MFFRQTGLRYDESRVETFKKALSGDPRGSNKRGGLRIDFDFGPAIPWARVAMNVKFRYPPVNEVVMGVYFGQPIALMRSEHIGVFWAQIRKDFPTIRQQPELTVPLASPLINFQLEFAEGLYPTPRYWLESDDSSFLIQIQRNAFIFNWRKRKNSYPHFDAVREKFEWYYRLFSSFINDEFGVKSPLVQIAELSYTNFVEPCEYWSGANDTGRVIPSFSLPSVGMSTVGDPDFNYLTIYKNAPDLSLHFGARTGRVPTDPSKSILIFDFRAIGALGAAAKPDTDAWFLRAHDIIGNCFTAVTSPDIQDRYWQPV